MNRAVYILIFCLLCSVCYGQYGAQLQSHHQTNAAYLNYGMSNDFGVTGGYGKYLWSGSMTGGSAKTCFIPLINVPYFNIVGSPVLAPALYGNQNSPPNGWSTQANFADGTQTPIAGDLELTFTHQDALSRRTGTTLGLGAVNINSSFNDVDYGIAFIQIPDGTFNLFVLELGSGGGITFIGNFVSVGDDYTIRRTGTTIEYLRNGVLFFTGANPSTQPLMFDSSSLNTTGTFNGTTNFSNLQICEL